MHIDTLEKNRLKVMKTTYNWRFYKIFGVIAAALIFACGSAASARQIRVGIAVSPALSLGGKGITASASGKTFSLPASFSARASGGSVVINGKKRGSVVILRSSAPIQCGKIRYEGEIVLRASGGSLTAVNRLDMEKYLRGVLGYEISPQWPMESLRAQAVISRTYALSQMGRHNSSGYDVCSGDHCQIYRGCAVHASSTDRAISSTRGQILTYAGRPALAYFSSDNGGASADVRDVWGTAAPYLVVRKEPFPSQSPKSQWQAVLSAGEIEAALAKKGKSVGKLKSISIVKRDAAGRSTMLLLSGTSGSLSMSSSAFRMAVGPRKVRSTFFDFAPTGKTPPAAVSGESRGSAPLTRRESGAMTPQPAGSLSPEEERELKVLIRQGALSVDDRFEMLVSPEKKRYYLNKARRKMPKKQPASDVVRRETAPFADKPPAQRGSLPAGSSSAAGVGFVSGGRIALYGRGWGHGVGLSQWGARAMADHGWTSSRILQFYYPGTVLKKY